VNWFASRSSPPSAAKRPMAIPMGIECTEGQRPAQDEHEKISSSRTPLRNHVRGKMASGDFRAGSCLPGRSSWGADQEALQDVIMV